MTFACPNMPKCPHPSFVHDIYDLEDDRPTCCVEGCSCGSGDLRELMDEDEDPP